MTKHQQGNNSRRLLACAIALGAAAAGCTPVQSAHRSIESDAGDGSIQQPEADSGSPSNAGTSGAPPESTSGRGSAGSGGNGAGNGAGTGGSPGAGSSGSAGTASTPMMSCPADQRGCGDGCIAMSACCKSEECPTGRSCVENACRCNEGTRSCGDGCIASDACCVDEDCSSGGECDAGSCKCPTGTHACGNRCASDTAVESCGTACEPCQAPQGGTVECTERQCTPKCPAGQRPCAGACIAENAPCTGVCASGSHDCSGVCIDNKSVNACGTRCTPCATPTNGTATCDGTSCGFTCSTGYKACGTRCIAAASCCSAEDCPSGASCSAAGACTCPAGQKLCGNKCIPNAGCCSNNECPQGSSCSASNTCACNSGFKDCNGTCIGNSACCSDRDCATNYACQNRSCVCIPQCSGKSCGPDGCGGMCTNRCAGDTMCNNSTGQCVPIPAVCGDGKTTGSEPCDPTDTTHWSTFTCTNDCKRRHIFADCIPDNTYGPGDCVDPNMVCAGFANTQHAGASVCMPVILHGQTVSACPAVTGYSWELYGDRFCVLACTGGCPSPLTYCYPNPMPGVSPVSWCVR